VIELLRSFDDVQVDLVKNDDLHHISITTYDKMIVSPGPDLPRAAGGLMPFLEQHIAHIPCLGICLGHQAIIQHFGGQLRQYQEPQHGERCQINVVQQDGLFQRLPRQFQVGLYHSWYAIAEDCPASLQPTAFCNNRVVMAIAHTELPIVGVQFHPESYMSEYGREILHNFIYC